MSESAYPATDKTHIPLSAWRRIVVKVGTSTLTAGSGRLNPPRMVDLVRQLAGLRQRGIDVVLVSSGAQQAGRERLGQAHERKSIPYKQMLAAVGQSRLMHLWEQYFELYDLIVAQVLLTREDIEDRHRYLNVRDTFESLLQRGIVPIVNENDAVATDEIKVGENDSLAAMVANLIEADLLILLTDIDGLYTADPTVDPQATLIERVEHIDRSIYELAKGAQSEMGTGGMYTKILAADMAVRSGTSVVIANGGRENVLAGIANGSVPATWFPAHITPTEGRKRWLLAHSSTAGCLRIDDGAKRALLERGKSLLPVGIIEVLGDFERGAIVGVRDRAGQEIARGLVKYSSRDLRRILGQHSGDIADILGYDYGPEIIHRDKMVLLASR
ncbi:MAG: glutamate 5-kinase [Chloroflexi bacterium]|nr:glutamate 5-kinase [Chloroflexota bacterium]